MEWIQIKPEHLEKLSQSFYAFLPKLVLGIVLLLVGFYIIRILLKGLDYALDRRDLDAALKDFARTLASILLKVLLFISVASVVGIPTTSFITLLGAAGLAIGMALQGSLGNFASSLDIQLRMWLKPGDYWDCYFEYIEKVKKALDQESITIPFPQRDVHLFEQKSLDH